MFFFLLSTLKGTTKAPAVDLLRLNTLRSSKTAFLTPKRNDEQPAFFSMLVFFRYLFYSVFTCTFLLVGWSVQSNPSLHHGQLVHNSSAKDIYVICQLGGLYGEKL